MSGSGFLMNWQAVTILQPQLKTTPILPVDDALIGIAMTQAGYTDRIINHTKFLPWGFREHQRDKFNICKMNDIILFHRFSLEESKCFWHNFINLRENCNYGTKKEVLTEVQIRCKYTV